MVFLPQATAISEAMRRIAKKFKVFMGSLQMNFGSAVLVHQPMDYLNATVVPKGIPGFPGKLCGCVKFWVAFDEAKRPHG